MSHRDFAERFLTALRAGEFDTLGGMLDPDFFVTEAEGLPYAGVYRGAQGWRDLSAAIIKTWAGFRLEFIEYAGESADTLVLRFRLTGRSRTTQKPFDTTVLELWRFRDGLLREIVPYYFDTHALVVANS